MNKHTGLTTGQPIVTSQTGGQRRTGRHRRSLVSARMIQHLKLNVAAFVDVLDAALAFTAQHSLYGEEMAPHGAHRGGSSAGGSQFVAPTTVSDDRDHGVHQRNKRIAARRQPRAAGSATSTKHGRSHRDFSRFIFTMQIDVYFHFNLLNIKQRKPLNERTVEQPRALRNKISIPFPPLLDKR
ncbi:hypothetical protein EYF80_043496 [Liparis tanakae]|uniref:Uncharacterized protein n=1 Tax=Liparis tanakae TaxID=230148 RepID=A0A4Z2FYB5_9TELE|nr:hypothetical protein EYF80_043496 [Liparis tanakae]